MMEPIPKGYESPQVIKPAGELTVGKQPTIEPSMPYTDFTDVEAAKKGRGFGEIAWDSSKWLIREAIMPALEKLIPQGASELAQALFMGHSYVPYGPTVESVDIPEPLGGIHGQAEEGPVADPTYPAFSAYEQELHEYTQRPTHENDRSRTR